MIFTVSAAQDIWSLINEVIFTALMTALLVFIIILLRDYLKSR